MHVYSCVFGRGEGAQRERVGLYVSNRQASKQLLMIWLCRSTGLHTTSSLVAILMLLLDTVGHGI